MSSHEVKMVLLMLLYLVHGCNWFDFCFGFGQLKVKHMPPLGF